jgi:signal transduction histidine kinase
MAGGISHEFNNRFTSVFGNLELIELGLARDSPARPRLLNIRLALQRAAGLSRQMLAFSGKGHFLAGAVDLNAVVAAHGRGLASTLPPSIRIECQLAEGLPPLKGDIRLIEQVLDALVQNAQEAMPPDGGAIRIATRLERLRGAVPGLQFPGGPFTPGAFVVLAVGDTGCGMSPELQAKAFDPFFTTKFTGRGLSLSAVLGILRVHDGGVQVQSAEGQGSLFTIYFPAGSAGCPRAFAELK